MSVSTTCQLFALPEDLVDCQHLYFAGKQKNLDCRARLPTLRECVVLSKLQSMYRHCLHPLAAAKAVVDREETSKSARARAQARSVRRKFAQHVKELSTPQIIEQLSDLRERDTDAYWSLQIATAHLSCQERAYRREIARRFRSFSEPMEATHQQTELSRFTTELIDTFCMIGDDSDIDDFVTLS